MWPVPAYYYEPAFVNGGNFFIYEFVGGTKHTYVCTYDAVPTSYVNSKSKYISPGVHSLFSVLQLTFLYTNSLACRTLNDRGFSL